MKKPIAKRVTRYKVTQIVIGYTGSENSPLYRWEAKEVGSDPTIYGFLFETWKRAFEFAYHSCVAQRIERNEGL